MSAVAISLGKNSYGVKRLSEPGADMSCQKALSVLPQLPVANR